MKVKVLKTFKDRHNGEIHRAGAVLIISKERFEEIMKVAPLVEKIEKKKE